MAISKNLARSLRTEAGLPYRLKAYVQDDNGAWVDISTDEFGPVQDRLVSVGTVQHSVEKRVGVFNTAISEMVLRNEDGLFTRNAFGFILQTTAYADAVFTPASNYSRLVFYRRKVKITARFTMDTAAIAYEESTLGVMYWDESSFDAESGQLRVRLKALSDALREIPADSVTDGLEWYSAKPSWFLIQELAKKAYGGSIPASWNIQSPIQIPVHDGSLTLSAYGRPADYQSGGWRNPTSHARALVYGTVGSVEGLWAGLDDSVWVFDPTTEQWTEKITSASIGAGKNVVFLYIQGTTLWGIAATPTTNSTAADEFGEMGTAGVVFSYDGTTYTTRQSETDMWTGRYAFRAVGQVTTNARTDCIGPYWDNGVSNRRWNGQAIQLPYDQRMFFLNTSGSDCGGIEGTGVNQIPPTTPPSADVSNLKTANALYTFGITDQSDWNTPRPHQRGSWILDTFNAEGYVKFSLNSSGAFAVQSYSGATYLYYFITGTENRTGDDIDPTFLLRRTRIDSVFTTATANTTSYTDDYPGATGGNPDRAGAPLCMCAGSATGVLYIGIYHSGWGSGSTSNTPHMYNNMTVWDYSEATAATTRHQFNVYTSGQVDFGPDDHALPGSLWKVVELVYFNSSLCGVFYSEGAGDWALVKDLQTWVDTSCTILLRSSTQPKGLVVDTTNTKLYFYEVGSGRVGVVNSSWGVSYVSNADSAVSGDVHLSAGLAIKQGSTPTLYGVSAPALLPEFQFETPPGKYHLFKLDTTITDRIELADFSDETAWSAMSKLAEATGSVVGFDENGNLFYRQRVSTTSAADFTLVHGSTELVEGEYPVDKVQVSSGESEIYNHVTLTPSQAIVKDPTYEIRLRKRTPQSTGLANDEQKSFLDFSVDVQNTRRQTIKLLCTNSADLNNTEGRHFVRFKYLVVQRVVEGQIAVDYTTGTSVTLTSVYGGEDSEDGIHPGDYLIATDPDDEGTEIVRAITAVNASTQVLTIDSAIGFNLDTGDTVRIVKKNTTSSAYANSEWSDEGVTYTTEASGTDAVVAVNSVEMLSVGTVVQIGKDYRRISVVDTTASPPEITVTDLDGTARNFSVSHASGSVVKAWCSPHLLDEFFEVGGTGVFIKFVKPTSGDFESRFIEGDLITLVNPGQELQEDEHAKQVSVNLASVRAFGRKDLSGQDNRYLTKSLARNLAHTLVGLFKDPKFDLEVTCRFGIDISIISGGGLSRVDVRSPLLFPTSAYKNGTTAIPFTVQCIVRGIRHDVARGTTQLTLKGVVPY